MDSHETWAPAVGGGGKRRRCPGACPGGGAAPPLEIEKQKKMKGHQSKFEASSPIFGYFFGRKYNFLTHFLSWAPPQKY